MPAASVAGLVAAAAPLRAAPLAPAGSNKFGIGVYNDTAAPPVDTQLPLAHNLTGDGGYVLLYFNLRFTRNGDASSCADGCAPPAWAAAAVRQAYALRLRPVVRLGQWPRTIRDFSDDAARRRYTSLAQAYRTFAAALPLPTNGEPLSMQILNEPNICGEWQCGGGGRLAANETAAETATCVRDIVAALRPLPRLRLSAAPVAYATFASCACDHTSPNPPPSWAEPSDVGFMRDMLRAAPDLYANVDFFNAHPYPFSGQPFDHPLGRAGAVNYRVQLNASGRPELPVLISEAGWKGSDQAMKAASIVAAYKQEWLPDARVEGVTPFLLSSSTAYDDFAWVTWVDGQPVYEPQYNATRQLRCGLGIGGGC